MKAQGGLFDVVFAIIADAQGEEFHQFAGVIFIGMLFAVLRVVEVIEHGGIFADGMDQMSEISRRHLRKQFVLIPHQPGRTFVAGAGGEMTMPEESEFFL